MLSELINHLWQSTFFAVLVAVLVLAFGKHSARVRYCLWFAASLKFLVPFSLLVTLGSGLSQGTPSRQFSNAAVQLASTPVAIGFQQFTRPFPATGRPPAARTVTAPDVPAGVELLPVTLGLLWLVGLGTVTLARLRIWFRLRAVLRISTPLKLPTSLVPTSDVRMSDDILEPGVVGLLRPVLLLPTGILRELSEDEMRAVLTHEMCHIRRNDNLTAAFHMVVEALFWFHPAIWWIGAKLIQERERASDEEVIRSGNAPEVYASGILSICKLYQRHHLACVSGVTDSNLRRRLDTILHHHLVVELSLARRILLTAAALTALATPIAIGIVAASSHPAPTISQEGLPPGVRIDISGPEPDTAPSESAAVPIDDEEAPSGSVEGVVLDSSTRMPLEGVSVVLTSAPASGRDQQYPGETDSNGHFAISVPSGSYSLDARLQGFFLDSAGSPFLSVAAGQSIEDLSIPLVSGGEINGRVLSENGEPLSGARVMAFQPLYLNGRRWVGPCDSDPRVDSWRSRTSQRTNELGEYRLTGLRPGEYYVAASRDSCWDMATYYPGVVRPNDAVQLRVESGSATSGIMLRLVGTDRYDVTIELSDLTGDLVAGESARVRISRVDLDGTASTVMEGDTDDLSLVGSGRYELPPLPAGSYEMLASTSLASIGETTFDVVNEPVAAGPLIVRPGVQVAGSIRTATGMTIPIEYDSLAVVLESTRMWWSQALPLPMRSDSSGDFSSEAARSFNLVAVGPYRVRVEGLPSGLYVSSLRYGAQDVLRQGFLQASAATEGERLDIVIDGPGGIVDGIVRNAADEPIPSAWVVLIPDAQRRQNVDLFRTALTDQTGRFSIDAVPPGGYGVLAWTGAVRQDWLDPTSLSAFETQTERIQIDNGDRETLDLDAIGRSD